MQPNELARYFDHTILKAVATEMDVRRICKEALTHRFFSVCVNPCYVPLVKEELKDSRVKTCCVVGFPLGANDSAIKARETALAVEQGADEIDMVMAVGQMKAGRIDVVQNDIAAVVQAAGSALVKVIIETCHLDEDEKVKACQVAEEAGAHFVKTSTGFGTGGATVTDVALMRETVGNRLKVKASGGIGNLQQALAMISAGADRLGASASVDIIKELNG